MEFSLCPHSPVRKMNHLHVRADPKQAFVKFSSLGRKWMWDTFLNMFLVCGMLFSEPYLSELVGIPRLFMCVLILFLNFNIYASWAASLYFLDLSDFRKCHLSFRPKCFYFLVDLESQFYELCASPHPPLSLPIPPHRQKVMKFIWKDSYVCRQAHRSRDKKL